MKPKQVVPNPERKPKVRAGTKTRKVDRSSDGVIDVTADSGITRPKRRCKQSVLYNESNQSSSSKESSDELSGQETVTVAEETTTKRRSDKVSQTSKTATAERSDCKKFCCYDMLCFFL